MDDSILTPEGWARFRACAEAAAGNLRDAVASDRPPADRAECERLAEHLRFALVQTAMARGWAVGPYTPIEDAIRMYTASTFGVITPPVDDDASRRAAAFAGHPDGEPVPEFSTPRDLMEMIFRLGNARDMIAEAARQMAEPAELPWSEARRRYFARELLVSLGYVVQTIRGLHPDTATPAPPATT